MKGNMLIVHGGAPTAVMNASLYGAIVEAQKHHQIEHIYGANGGTGGILREEFLDLSAASTEKLNLLLQTPASAIGTSRDRLEPEDYQRMVEILRRHNIRWLLVNGGNGSMDTCGKIQAAADGNDIAIVGIPKTIDNDIAVTDHAPGYGSAARYIAATVSEISQDIMALPIHVCIVETMGRNAGWIAAASALARGDGGGPDLIYLPERPFDEDAFLEQAEQLYRQKGGVMVVVSEGLRNQKGEPVGKPIFEVDRSVYYGDVGSELANLVIRRLGIKARSEKPGLCGRASIAHQSQLDLEEAILAGAEAVKASLQGITSVMVGFRRVAGEDYRVEIIHIPIQEVMLHEKTLPDSYIHANNHDVTDSFVHWCRPLIGPPLRKFANFRHTGV